MRQTNGQMGPTVNRFTTLTAYYADRVKYQLHGFNYFVEC